MAESLLIRPRGLQPGPSASTCSLATPLPLLVFYGYDRHSWSCIQSLLIVWRFFSLSSHLMTQRWPP